MLTTEAQPRSGGRVQPTARAVGGASQEPQAPEGRKKMSHTLENILLHFICFDARAPAVNEEGIS